MITIRGPKSKLMPAVLGGDPSPVLQAWFDYAKGQRLVESYTEGGTQVLIIPSNSANADGIKLALSEGFTVEGAPLFILMDADTYAGQVPEGISNRTYDNDGVDVVRTWADWHSPTHSHMDAADGRKIVAAASWGVELSSAELLALLTLGYTMIMPHEVAAFLPDLE